MFDRVLVANRGEIACRISRTLRRLGIEVVAVHSEADRHAPHVLEADAAIELGPAPAAESYLQIERVIAAALSSSAQAVHPGYGLLSESADFAEACEEAGLVFIGPTPAQIRAFGLKHSARQLVQAAGVPLLPGTGLLEHVDDARRAAESLSYPLLVKASAGGGGIGMRRCDGPDELGPAFEAAVRQAEAAFGGGGVYLERFIRRARHVEVQAFGDGRGTVLVLGERDCSVQRRHQKVIEECPAPDLPDDVRAALVDHARALLAPSCYRSAGTVEFVVDADRLDVAFLEVNARLQVEHGVTELVYGVDLVEWMIRLAAGEDLDKFGGATSADSAGDSAAPSAGGSTVRPIRWHAVEARVYAEDPLEQYRPSAGLVTEASWPDGRGIRVDTWVGPGTEVTSWYDPLLGKVLASAPSRSEALAALQRALASTRIGGVRTNLEQLRDALADVDFRRGAVTTGFLDALVHGARVMRVRDAGMFSTVQELPGRLGLWAVGVPPSGPMDDLSFRLVNELVGNRPGTAALEMTVSGATLSFDVETVVAAGGARMDADLDGAPLPWWEAVMVPAGSALRFGELTGPGSRTYLAVAGGIDVPEHLGSRATFVLGRFGGHGGRALQVGDVLALHEPGDAPVVGRRVPDDHRPVLSQTWEVGVLTGPQAAPDYFTPSDLDEFFTTSWKVHHHSDRTGVRLIGPRPSWARSDGGEAGLHPSNIHDNPYVVGTIDYTGDMPIVLMRDGPSCGGFISPATVATGELWKIGQARAGDCVRFVPVDHDEATRAARAAPRRSPQRRTGEGFGDPVLYRATPDGERPGVVVRRAGDTALLVEVGDATLDLGLRLRVGALMEAVAQRRLPGLGELVPGVRSLQVSFDPDRMHPSRLVGHLLDAWADTPPLDRLEVPSRIVHLPLSWDDPATRRAIEVYMRTVRADAPWCPWNIEFIRRINGLDTVDDVKAIVFDASYLVLALGDVYLGAPVATPVDPRHRLVTTKYNPARTWTAENSVGIGGAYLCIYGMEGPGGYQFVGRTVQVWNSWRSTPAFEQPWLLRFFDQIRWYPVSADELLRLRDGFTRGRVRLDVEDTVFRWSDHLAFLGRHREEIAAFTARREAAFAAERARWEAAGVPTDVLDIGEGPGEPAEAAVPPGQVAVRSPVTGAVWKVLVQAGAQVEAGDPVASIEAMKMETIVRAPSAGRITKILVQESVVVDAGRALALIAP